MTGAVGLCPCLGAGEGVGLTGLVGKVIGRLGRVKSSFSGRVIGLELEPLEPFSVMSPANITTSIPSALEYLQYAIPVFLKAGFNMFIL